MATKQARSNADENNERARAILPAFGASGDPWRDGPALAGLTQALSPDRSKPYGNYTCPAYTDRYGTNGAGTDADFHRPATPEAAQKPDAQQKGASTGAYRVPISGVVQ